MLAAGEVSLALTAAPIYDRRSVPAALSGGVHRQAPSWAVFYPHLPQQQVDNISTFFTEDLADMEALMPSAPWARRGAELPTFEIDPRTPGLRAARDQVAMYVAQEVPDPQLAAGLVGRGPVGLAVCASALADLDYDAVANVEACKRLHRLLVQATGWEKLHVAEVDDLGEFRAYNQPLGDLWAWFVNNCAFNEPTWEAYRDLRRLR